MWLLPVVAARDEKIPAVKTIAMNMREYDSVLLKTLALLPISCSPTRYLWFCTLVIIADFRDAAIRDRSSVSPTMNTARRTITVAANSSEARTLSWDVISMESRGIRRTPEMPTRPPCTSGLVIFSSIERASRSITLCASAGVISRARIAVGIPIARPTPKANRTRPATDWSPSISS